MPRGLNRTDLNKTGTSYRNGTPITLPHTFGNVVNWTPDPAHFGNPVTKGNDPTQFGNPVTLPHDFGNDIGNPSTTSGFELENGTGVLLLENGSILLLENQ